MAAISRREHRSTVIWPGFVDALATMLMVIIFLLLIFVVAQFFLGQALSGRDKALLKLESELSQLASVLALEKADNERLSQDVANLTTQLSASLSARSALETDLAQIRAQFAETDAKLRESLAVNKADQAAIERQLSEISDLSHDIAALRALKEELERDVSALAQRAESAETDRDALKSTLEETKSALAKTEAERADFKASLAAEKEISDSARAQLALLNKQMAALRQQLAALNQALDASEAAAADRDAQIRVLGSRLNAALANKVQELSRYRSEFFGRLRELIGNRKDVRIVGDRFVLQSELLFAKSSADLGEGGKAELFKIAETLLEIAEKVPPDIDWILRIDGHTDSDPIHTAAFPSNWELSTARAISVVKHLIASGLPPERLAATGFGEFAPIEKGGSEAAKSRNRRIELKLTQR